MSVHVIGHSTLRQESHNFVLGRARCDFVDHDQRDSHLLYSSNFL